MKKTNKILSVIMALIMIISIIPMSNITANAATSGKCGDNLTWTFDDSTGSLTISGTGKMYSYFNESEGEVIERPWESYKDKIKTVVICDGVTTIGDWTFNSCETLTNVTIGDSVRMIGDYAFSQCNSLANFTVDINNQYFSSDECGILFNKDKTILIQYPGCNVRTSYLIPNSVTTIDESAFFGCVNLSNITIPDSVTKIGDSAFEDCDRLTNITVDSDNEYYSSDEDGVLFNKDKTVLIKYPQGNTRTCYIIPDSVITIDVCAFFDSKALTNLTIGKGVKTIGERAFVHCYGLTSIIIPDNVTTILDFAFYSCYHLTSITLGNGITSIGDYAFCWYANLTNVYYNGSEVEWNTISFGDGNDELLTANIHFKECAHKFGNWTSITNPTCIEDGFERRVCSECGEEETRVIYALCHSDNDGDECCDLCSEILGSSAKCDHNCHKSGIAGFIWKLVNFFNRIFGSKKYCDCGVSHY